MNWRMMFGWVTAAGLALLFCDQLTIGASTWAPRPSGRTTYRGYVVARK